MRYCVASKRTDAHVEKVADPPPLTALSTIHGLDFGLEACHALLATGGRHNTSEVRYEGWRAADTLNSGLFGMKRSPSAPIYQALTEKDPTVALSSAPLSDDGAPASCPARRGLAA